MMKQTLRDALDILDDVDIPDGHRVNIYARLKDAYNNAKMPVYSNLCSSDVIEFHNQRMGTFVRVRLVDLGDEIRSLLNVVWYNQMRLGTRIYVPEPGTCISRLLNYVASNIDTRPIIKDIGEYGNFKKIHISDGNSLFDDISLDATERISISAFATECVQLRILYELLHPFVDDGQIGAAGSMVERISEWVRDSCGTSVGFIDYCVFNMLNWFWNVEHELSVMNDLAGKSIPSTRSSCSSFEKRAKLLKMYELAKTSNSRFVTAIQSMQLVYIRKLSCRNAYDWQKHKQPHMIVEFVGDLC